MKALATFAFAALLATQAFAHSKMNESTPSDGAVLTEAPTSIALRFVQEIKLTMVRMVREGAEETALPLGDQTGFEKAYTLPVDTMEPGLYQIAWRGLGMDGHAMTGAFSYRVE